MNPLISINRVTPGEAEEVIRFIASLNSISTHQCLHCDTEYDGIAREVAELLHSRQAVMLRAVAGGTVTGVIACELNGDATHARLRGPFVDGTPWSDTARLLYDALRTDLPDTVHDLLAFPGLDNERARDFYTAQGFRQQGTVHIYIAPAPEYTEEQPAGVQEYDPALFPQFEVLYNQAFPLAVETARDITDRSGDDVRICVAVDNGVLQGFVVTSLNDAPTEGFIEALVVHPEQRGRGLGETLLRAALHWCFHVRRMPQTGLCVRDTNVNARSLYERVGFRLFASGADMRLTTGISSDAEPA